MGIDDRDYMRERYRRRAGLTRWNDGRARIEAARLDAGHLVHRRGQPTRLGGGVALRLIVAGLCALLILVPLYGDAQRRGWLPDFSPGKPFPETGSVTVGRNIARARITSALTVVAADPNAVVQLFDPDTDAHVLSVYVAGNRRITIPAPAGTFRMRLIEGKKWHGARRYFGPKTSFETVARLMTFEPGGQRIVDLHRRPDGNLKTRPMISGPVPL